MYYYFPRSLALLLSIISDAIWSIVERERERERERETHTKGERERDRERDRQTERERERQRGQTKRQSDRTTEKVYSFVCWHQP